VRANRVDRGFVRAFVRFRATGDANALAAVFDATAPELRHPVQRSTPASRSERTSWLRLEITLPPLEPK
jgi:hypothetical protein